MAAGIIQDMARIRNALAAAALVVFAAPLAAQMNFSESYNFLKAVKERDGNAAQTVLDNPASTAINARDRDSGEGALHILVRGRDLSWLGFLLSRGARPDIQNKDGMTPLALAAQIGWIEGAEQLLARGAGVNLANNRGETPLILAVQRRDLPMVRLLLGQGADPDATDSAAGLSAMDYARRDRRSAAIVRLLEEGPGRRPREAMGPTR